MSGTIRENIRLKFRVNSSLDPKLNTILFNAPPPIADLVANDFVVMLIALLRTPFIVATIRLAITMMKTNQKDKKVCKFVVFKNNLQLNNPTFFVELFFCLIFLVDLARR